MAEVPPTRMNQQIFKGKLKAAQGGHKLLKKKADALKVSLLVVESVFDGCCHCGAMFAVASTHQPSITYDERFVQSSYEGIMGTWKT
jgi:hypothetical protein